MTLFMTDFQHSSQGENQEKHCNEISCISVELDEEQRESKVETIAYLARLYLSHEEKKTFSSDLKNVFQWIDKLNHLCPEGGTDDLSDPLIGLQALREDCPWDPAMNPQGHDVLNHEGPKDVLQNAPMVRHNYVLVPKIIETA